MNSPNCLACGGKLVTSPAYNEGEWWECLSCNTLCVTNQDGTLHIATLSQILGFEHLNDIPLAEKDFACPSCGERMLDCLFMGEDFEECLQCGTVWNPI